MSWRYRCNLIASALCTVGAAMVCGVVEGAETDGKSGEFFAKYCLDCHGDKKTKGDLNMQPIVAAPMTADPWVWQGIREQIVSEEMPPEDPLPSAEERRAILQWIDAGMQDIDWASYRRPGRSTMARLTRDEYRHTMRDLLGIDLHGGERFPIEGEGGSGFTNDGDNLALTPALLEAYFDESERLIDAVFALRGEPARQRFSAAGMAAATGHQQFFGEGAMLVHPGNEIQANVQFPVHGYYRFELMARNFGKPSIVEMRIGGNPVAATWVKSGKRERVVAVGFVRAGDQAVTLQSRNLVPQAALPGDAGRRVLDAAALRAARLDPRPDGESDAVQKSRAALNERSAAIQEAYEWLRILGPEADSREIDRFRKYALERDAGSETARDNMATALEMSRADFDTLWEAKNAAVLAGNRRLLEAVAHVRWGDWQGYQGKIIVDSMEVVGPVEDGGAPPTEFADASGALSVEFLQRAFRRSVDAAEWQRYESVRQQAVERGESADDALKLAVSAVLVSAEFLLHRQQGESVGDDEDVPANALALDDFSLASRLSYFIWQSMPDEELLSLARDGELREPGVLRQQLQRMLADEKAEAFFGAFTEQWLGLAALGRGVGADRNRYPEFTPELASAMCDEATLWFRHVLRSDLDLMRLIDADETFVNGVLAKHYGIAGVDGAGWRRVELSDRNRGGVLGMAAVLTATSAPTRAHPSRRGTWVLETLLGQQQGEPLADAGELPGDAGEGRGRTLRDELDLHRSRAECVVCHDVIDPVGLGLQSFDALGRWRDLEAGAEIDDRGQLPDGEIFDGPAELKQALSRRRSEVLRQLSAEMLAFALGRELQPFDFAEVQRIAAKVADSGGSAHALLEAVVTSLPFRYTEKAQP